MRRRSLGYALLGGLVGILAFNMLLPKILGSALSFGVLVALLLVGGLVLVVVSARRMVGR